MKIFVQARKDGYNTLYPPQTPNEFRHFASDIILIRNQPDNIYGKCVYSIAFSNEGCIYTKHLIVQDVQRGGLGNVGFSIHIPKNNKLSGNNIKNLLDELINAYIHNYCPDFYLGNVQEDWVLFSSLANSYDSKLTTISSDDFESSRSSSLEAAFIYYNSDLELQQYFEKPHQEEYHPHKQIYLLSNEFKAKSDRENPLFILKNSGVDLTGKIDLVNPPLTLRNFNGFGNNGISITIRNQKGVTLSNGNKVYGNDILTVRFNKKNHKEKTIEGSLNNNEEIRKYLVVNNDNKIDVSKEIYLDPDVKTITFDVVKKDGSKVFGYEITCKNSYQAENKVINNQVTFSGDALNERWTVSAKKGDSLFSKSYVIDFDKDNLSNFKLELNESRKLRINVNESVPPHNYIPKFKVLIQGKGNYDENDIEFVDDEINKSFNIKVECTGYQRSESQTYSPSIDGNKTLYFTLKKPNLSAPIKNQTDNFPDSQSISTNNNLFWYQKPKFIAISILSVLILGLGTWMFIKNLGKKEDPLTTFLSHEKVEKYLNGDEYFLNTLISYKEKWDQQNPNYESNDASPSKIAKWKTISDSLESAISKRKFLDNMNFKELKKVHFNNCESLEDIIQKIKEKNYELLKGNLNDISKLKLSEIAFKIDSLSQPVNNPPVNNPPVNNPPVNNPPVNNPPVNNPVDSETYKDIIGKIKSGDISKTELDVYKGQIKNDQKLSNSIKLLSELWGIKSSDNKCKNYLNKIIKNDYLKMNPVLIEVVTLLKDKEKNGKPWNFPEAYSLEQILTQLKR